MAYLSGLPRMFPGAPLTFNGLPEIPRVTRPLCHDVGQPHYRYYMMLPQSAPLSPDGLKLQHQSSSPCHHKQLPTNTQLKLQHLSPWTMPCSGQLSTLTPSLFQVPNWLHLCSMKDPLDVVRVGAWNSLTHTRLPHQNTSPSYSVGEARFNTPSGDFTQ